MGWRAWTKMIVVSAGLGSAGILVCIVALLDVLVPRGSVLGFLSWMAALVGVIVVLVAGYVWVCDKCEDYLSGRLERLLAAHEARGKASKPGRAEEREPANERRTLLPFPQSSAERYVGTLSAPARPARVSPRAVAAEPSWHGQ
jgi:hypothetical protein